MSTIFTKIGTYDGSGVASTHFNCNVVKGNFNYIGAADGLWIVDISNKAVPVLKAHNTAITDNVAGIAISEDGNTLYIAGVGLSEEAIYIINVTDKTNPIQIGEILLTDIDNQYSGFVTENQSLLLLDSNTLAVLVHDNSPLANVVQCIDISDPTNPTGITNPIGFDSKSENDLILQITNDALNLFVAYINTDSDPVTRIEHYDMTAPASPSLVYTSDNTITGNQDIFALCVDGTNVYEIIHNIAGTFFEILIYPWDEGDTTPIIYTTTISTAHEVTQAVVSNNFLVVTDYSDGSTTMYDVTNPSTISVIHHDPADGGSVSIAYPYFYTTNDGLSDDQLFIWFINTNVQAATRFVFDKWWDEDEQKDRCLMVDGSSDILHWSGGFANVLSSTGNSITKSGGTTWQQAGFSTSSGEKLIMIEDVEYTYTGGESTNTLTGVTPDPSGITVGAVALQSVLTQADTPAAGFNNDFIKVINNQAYIGSYTSRLCYISSSTDFKNYSVPTPRAAGDPELLTLDGTLKGIGVRQGNAHIGYGTDSWAVITFSDITVGDVLTQQTKVDVKPVAVNQAPYAHEFIDTVGDSLIYLALDQQVRSFGDFNNLFTPGYPSLSQEIATEIMGQNFTGGGLRCIGEFVYVTAPNEGTTYLYQVRSRVDGEGNVVAERLWQSPFIWNLTRVDSINGVIVGFSNANPQIYELWDTGQWHDDSPSGENLPYSCIMALGYRTNNRRQGLQSFDKNFTEGYITQGTPLNLTLNYNYQGASGIKNAVVNSIALPATLFTNANPASLGDSSLGDEPLGDSIFNQTDPQDTLPKFKVINSVGLTNCFEYQPIYSSDAADSRWEILASGTNATEEPDQDATFIINKQRTT